MIHRHPSLSGGPGHAPAVRSSRVGGGFPAAPSPQAHRAASAPLLTALFAALLTAPTLRADLAPLDDDHGPGSLHAMPIPAGLVPSGTSGLTTLLPAGALATSAAPLTLTPGPVATSVPRLSSYPQASRKLYLDFNGINFAGAWGSSGRTPGNVPAYDTDNDPTTFSSAELNNLVQIWCRVAEAYSPFNIDVTTIDPGTPAFGSSVRVVVGGSNDWYAPGYGGVAYISGYRNGGESSGTAWVFPVNLGNGDPKYTAIAAAHEAGHLFGLHHQQQRNPDGTLVADYRSFENDPATSPIMGNGYGTQRAVWSNGVTGYANGALLNEDGIAQIGSTASSPYNNPLFSSPLPNDFGFRPDDYADTLANATFLSGVSGTFTVTGVIGNVADVDMFRFYTIDGSVSLTLNPVLGGMLDARLLLYDNRGTLLQSVDPAISGSLSDWGLGASLTTTLAPGYYYVAAASHGAYGDVGQYTLTGVLTRSLLPDPAGTGLLLIGSLPCLLRRRAA